MCHYLVTCSQGGLFPVIIGLSVAGAAERRPHAEWWGSRPPCVRGLARPLPRHVAAGLETLRRTDAMLICCSVQHGSAD